MPFIQILATVYSDLGGAMCGFGGRLPLVRRAITPHFVSLPAALGFIFSLFFVTKIDIYEVAWCICIAEMVFRAGLRMAPVPFSLESLLLRFCVRVTQILF